MIAGHLRPVGDYAGDYVGRRRDAADDALSLGRRRRRSASTVRALVQLSMRMAGRDVPRDSDMQGARLGRSRSIPATPMPGSRRGDLVFWKGHVAIMTDAADDAPRQRPYTCWSRARAWRDAIAPQCGYLYGGPTRVEAASSNRSAGLSSRALRSTRFVSASPRSKASICASMGATR